MTATIGELCAGYGGLGMGVSRVIDAEVAWYSEIDKGALKVLEHRFPGVPNIGDMTTVDWASVPRVDVLTAGFPCQPVSHAGKRLGDLDERWLWDDVARAVGTLRPSLVVLENVRGLLTAGAGRLFGRVLGALADLGYDAQWHGLRAAEVGAPHGRWRVFVAAYPRGEAGFQWTGLRESEPAGLWRGQPARDHRATVLPAPTTRDHKGRNQRDDASCLAGALMPTPRATDGTKGGPNQRGSSGDPMLPSAVTLLPTPAAQEPGGTLDQYHARLKAADGRDSTFAPLSMAVQESGRWGDYADAIARWEKLTRPAPEPTMLSRKGTPQLSPAFSEWMMGLPAGWVTDVPGITRNEALRALGNGVVPQQAEAAVSFLLDVLSREVAA